MLPRGVTASAVPSASAKQPERKKTDTWALFGDEAGGDHADFLVSSDIDTNALADLDDLANG